jgi:hypothetical protein
MDIKSRLGRARMKPRIQEWLFIVVLGDQHPAESISPPGAEAQFLVPDEPHAPQWLANFGTSTSSRLKVQRG